jgi:pentapeptide repeat protein
VKCKNPSWQRRTVPRASQNGRVAKWSRTRAWARKWWLLPASVTAVVLIVLFIYLLPPLLVRPKGLITAAERLGAENAVRGTLLQAFGGAVLLLGVYFTARTFDLNRHGQVTERFTRAIDQLGRKDSLDVRLGGIYALERIARDSRDDHGPVFEVLTAFIREHAPWQPTEPPPEKAPIPADIQAILTALGRRNPANDPPGPLNLWYMNLRDTNRPDTSPWEANLEGTNLKGANLWGANLRGANLRGANLEGGILQGVNLEGANLRGATLREARLALGTLQDAYLSEVNLQEANLWATNLERANLVGASLAGANLAEANLAGAYLEGTNLEGANLDGANLEGANLKDARFDSQTKWPEDFDAEGKGRDR